ncbi:HlyD family efflux transporter periplasmic adaptor subunit [Clostridium bowmanii]|uniref:HlyD family efflux transporter periplasmic adaptor subunit n=1 Tax=Clostridium bowmanii TaxID=132925 RepID=UPI001C0BED5C|nr:HlyD family efflux transporter periplasmic adaptor subunit [Clostridium bowmanii]MBU3190630.1 HlyD family efflux transporter periplasmic adaptor subunit [Clostridium bowmanii]MCA1072526.1 HlyD family efflux transporter periplasmic adaptor subunit [Clostridium bowmanii]
MIASVSGFKSSFIQNKFFAKKVAIKQNTTIAEKGNLKVIVSGSGPIYFTNSSIIYSKIGATVTKVNYKEGDSVKAGDIIYELDDTDAQTALNSDSNSFKQNQISASTSNDAVSDLSIKAPFTGLVSDILVKQGDTVSKGGTVFTIADTTKLKVLLTYNASSAGKIAIGQTANVYLTSLMQSVSGNVTYISNQTTATSAGGKLYTVEIQINNPGAVVEGMTASADISATGGVISSTGTAELNYIKKQLVTSSTGGTVESISIKQNQKVSSGQALIKMSSDEIARAKENSDLQLESAQSQMALKTKQLDYYKIIAPINGVITKMTNKVGDTIKAGDELSDVSDPTQMEFDIPVDELAIAKLKVGQDTSITVDALPATTETPVKGAVSKIAVTGTSESGVTTFVVTVKVNDNLDKLKGGMNANGEILVSNKENVLNLPIEAITTTDGKSFVYVSKAGSGPIAGVGGNGAMGGRTGHVELPLVYKGVHSREAKRRAIEALTTVSLKERMHHRPSELSGGQQQRVAIARALVTRPPVLLADEPTGALDSKTGIEVMGILKELNSNGHTIILITHDNDLAAEAKRIIRISDGEITEDKEMAQ